MATGVPDKNIPIFATLVTALPGMASFIEITNQLNSSFVASLNCSQGFDR